MVEQVLRVTQNSTFSPENDGYINVLTCRCCAVEASASLGERIPVVSMGHLVGNTITFVVELFDAVSRIRKG